MQSVYDLVWRQLADDSDGVDVDGATDDVDTDDDDEPRTKSRRTKFLQGATVFVVMFVTMFATLRWLQSRGDEQSE